LCMHQWHKNGEDLNPCTATDTWFREVQTSPRGMPQSVLGQRW
jgi:hypothetical protein